MASPKVPSETKVKLSDLEEYPNNPRKHGQSQIDELKRSLEMFGQYRPLVLNKKKQILAGNGMYRAMVELGWTEGTALIMSNLTEAEQKKLVLADNQIARMGMTNFDLVDDLLREIGDYQIPGYDEETIQSLLESTAESLESAQEYGVLDLDEVESLQQGADRIEEATEDYDFSAPAPAASPTEYREDGSSPGTATSESGSVCSACGRAW